jgi:ankyrin repeat protein
VAIRPLCVEELAELLAYDFDTTEEGIPIVNPNWRWEDHEEAVLSTCSSLIAVVSDGDSLVIQFSHFSVKEFLTSNRLASSGGDVTHHCISLELAHTLFAQACLGTLLSLDDKAGGSGSVGSGSGNFPLAGYAAQHWMAHARIDKVSSRVKTGMQQLFDPTKPQFSAWIQLYDVDVQFWKSPKYMTSPIEPTAAPLYYAANCGFRGLVEHLLIKYPQHVNARGGGRGAALHAASAENHIDVAQLLLEHGGDVNLQGVCKRTPLQFAAIERHLELGKLLLGHGAEVDSRQEPLRTPLHHTARNGYVDFSRMLLKHKADVNSRDYLGRVPLHRVSEISIKNRDYPGVARLLLEHGADVGAKDKDGATPLHLASSKGKTDIVRLLLGHGANANAEDDTGRSSLYLASSDGNIEVVRLLLDHGANADAENTSGRTPLQVALESGKDEVAQMLAGHVAQRREL